MNNISLSLVVLRFTDLERAARFYESLGLKFIRHRHGGGPEHLSAVLGGCVFEIYPQSPKEATTIGTRIGFRVPSLDAVIMALSDFPAAIVTPPQESPWGRRAVVSDPEGHRIELVQE
jgi:lactoylglutathione lyase